MIFKQDLRLKPLVARRKIASRFSLDYMGNHATIKEMRKQKSKIQGEGKSLPPLLRGNFRILGTERISLMMFY